MEYLIVLLIRTVFFVAVVAVLASEIQRRATEYVTGRADARAVRQATGREADYNAGKL
jgi:hypothetical protein